jgi:hypothetical protein
MKLTIPSIDPFEAKMRNAMMKALLCTFVAILGNSILAEAGDNSVSVLPKPVLSLQLNSHTEMARTVSAATHDRRLQTDGFQGLCERLEVGLGEGVSCECDAFTRTAACVFDEECNIDTCATIRTVTTLDAALNLMSVETCVEYSIQTADYRDACFTLIYLENNAQIIRACELAYVDDSGSPTDCNGCRVCDGRIEALALDIDCSNIEVEASTSGCVSFEFLPGSSASVGPSVGLVRAAAVATLLLVWLQI